MPNRVTGLKLTTENLHRLGINVEVIVGPALLEIGGKVREDMQQHVRKDTHRLEENIVVGPVERHGDTVSVKIGPNKKGWYARFLEFGTRAMGSFPFMRPARERIRAEIKPRLRDLLAKGTRV